MDKKINMIKLKNNYNWINETEGFYHHLLSERGK